MSSTTTTSSILLYVWLEITAYLIEVDCSTTTTALSCDFVWCLVGQTIPWPVSLLLFAAITTTTTTTTNSSTITADTTVKNWWRPGHKLFDQNLKKSKKEKKKQRVDPAAAAKTSKKAAKAKAAKDKETFRATTSSTPTAATPRRGGKQQAPTLLPAGSTKEEPPPRDQAAFSLYYYYLGVQILNYTNSSMTLPSASSSSAATTATITTIPPPAASRTTTTITTTTTNTGGRRRGRTPDKALYYKSAIMENQEYDQVQEVAAIVGIIFLLSFVVHWLVIKLHATWERRTIKETTVSKSLLRGTLTPMIRTTTTTTSTSTTANGSNNSTIKAAKPEFDDENGTTDDEAKEEEGVLSPERTPQPPSGLPLAAAGMSTSPSQVLGTIPPPPRASTTASAAAAAAAAGGGDGTTNDESPPREVSSSIAELEDLVTQYQNQLENEKEQSKAQIAQLGERAKEFQHQWENASIQVATLQQKLDRHHQVVEEGKEDEKQEEEGVLQPVERETDIGFFHSLQRQLQEEKSLRKDAKMQIEYLEKRLEEQRLLMESITTSSKGGSEAEGEGGGAAVLKPSSSSSPSTKQDDDRETILTNQLEEAKKEIDKQKQQKLLLTQQLEEINNSFSILERQLMAFECRMEKKIVEGGGGAAEKEEENSSSRESPTTPNDEDTQQQQQQWIKEKEILNNDLKSTKTELEKKTAQIRMLELSGAANRKRALSAEDTTTTSIPNPQMAEKEQQPGNDAKVDAAASNELQQKLDALEEERKKLQNDLKAKEDQVETLQKEVEILEQKTQRENEQTEATIRKQMEQFQEALEHASKEKEAQLQNQVDKLKAELQQNEERVEVILLESQQSNNKKSALLERLKQQLQEQHKQISDSLEEIQGGVNNNGVGGEQNIEVKEINIPGPPAVPPNSDDHLVVVDAYGRRPPYVGRGSNQANFGNETRDDNELETSSSAIDSKPPALRTFTKSLSLSSFFSGSKRGNFNKGAPSEDVQQEVLMEATASSIDSSKPGLRQTFTKSASSFLFGSKRVIETPSTEKVLDEMKRAIDDARWQEVVNLASNMAAEVPLQSPLAESSYNDQGGDGGGKNRRHLLSPEDAEKAAQLDVCLQDGDWITLAARAAVFAALPDSSVGSISFVEASDC